MLAKQVVRDEQKRRRAWFTDDVVEPVPEYSGYKTQKDLDRAVGLGVRVRVNVPKNDLETVLNEVKMRTILQEQGISIGRRSVYDVEVQEMLKKAVIDNARTRTNAATAAQQAANARTQATLNQPEVPARTARATMATAAPSLKASPPDSLTGKQPPAQPKFAPPPTTTTTVPNATQDAQKLEARRSKALDVLQGKRVEVVAGVAFEESDTPPVRRSEVQRNSLGPIVEGGRRAGDAQTPDSTIRERLANSGLRNLRDTPTAVNPRNIARDLQEAVDAKPQWRFG